MASPSDPARTFLERTLPWDDAAEGWLNVHWKKSEHHWPGESRRNVDAMLAEVSRLAPTHDVYCCMSSQSVSGKRSGPGARFLKSLFLDVDVKEGFYASTAEALAALNAFTDAVSLPPPTMRVMSGGGGFHAHWILASPAAKAEWLRLAKALKRAAKQHGLVLDMGVIADAARILRIPGALNHKYPEKPPVILDPAIVDRDYSLAAIADPLEPYMRMDRIGRPSAAAGVSAPRLTQPSLLDGARCDWNDLGPRRVDFDEFRDAVEHLTRKGWFDRPHYHHWRDLVFAAGYVAMSEPAHENDARALVEEVCETAGRDPEKAEKRIESGVERARARIAAGEEVIRTGTIYLAAREQGWTPPGEAWARPPESPHETSGGAPAIGPAQLRAAHERALHVVKRRLNDAFLIAVKLPQPRMSKALLREARAVPDASVRSKLMFALAALLLKSGHSPPEIADAVVACGLKRSAALNVLSWALRNVAKGETA
jgi:hypothetical protein